MIIKNYINDPFQSITLALSRRGLLSWMPDKMYLKLMYRARIKKKLELENPKTYNEKLQWLKLYDRRQEYTQMVDKYAVRQFVSDRIGEKYLVPLLGGPWSSFNEIDFDALPDQFVLKCTHDSGGVIICCEKENLDQKYSKRIIEKSLQRNYYKRSREWPYKNVNPQIIAEQYLTDESGTELKDYKFFAFDGTVKAVFVATDRYAKTETRFDFYDENFQHLPFTNGHPNAKIAPHKPKNYDEMVKIAETLSRGFPHVRVDLYNVDGKIYFGELTLYHWSGMVPFEPEDWDRVFGDWISLPNGTSRR